MAHPFPAGVSAVGALADPDLLVTPLHADRTGFFAPRGAWLGGAGEGLWVADSGHHRVLGWRGYVPEAGAPARVLLGQAGDHGEARNAGERLPAAQGLNLPVGICRAGDGLAVADSWNHRVLLWRAFPGEDRTPPDCVLGQPDLTAMEINRGRSDPASDTLYWPYGVHWDGAHLYVCDAGNRRVLIWDGLPERDGQPADRVLGQDRFDCRDENGGRDPDAAGMRWPHAACRWGDRLCIADAGNHRVMVWERLPERDGQPADLLLGQRDPAGVHNNGGALQPDGRSLSMPYGLAALDGRLWVADTANSRLLAWRGDRLDTGTAASAVFGQPDFHQRGENRWRAMALDTLCWPYGLQAGPGCLVVADSGNHRVLILPGSSLPADT